MQHNRKNQQWLFNNCNRRVFDVNLCDQRKTTLSYIYSGFKEIDKNVIKGVSLSIFETEQMPHILFI